MTSSEVTKRISTQFVMFSIVLPNIELLMSLKNNFSKSVVALVLIALSFRSMYCFNQGFSSIFFSTMDFRADKSHLCVNHILALVIQIWSEFINLNNEQSLVEEGDNCGGYGDALDISSPLQVRKGIFSNS